MPQGWTPDQVKQFLDYWDTEFGGDLARRRRSSNTQWPSTGRNRRFMLYISFMRASNAFSLPTDFASELERKYFWWEHVGVEPRSHARILAQAMSWATLEDASRLEAVLGPERLADAMLTAEPGWISERSWEFWRARLQLATGRAIPEAPPRRSFDEEER